MKEPIYAQQEYELVREIVDEAIGLRGYLVIGSRIGGLTCGGLRIHQQIDTQELKDLAKVMELKQMFIGMPRGGARGGIVADYHLPEADKQRLIRRYAELVRDELADRKWLVAIDVGTNAELIFDLYRHVGVTIPKPSLELANAGYFTSLSVAQAIAFCLEERQLPLAGCTVAIEGLGNVGSNLYRVLRRRGARIVAVSNQHGAIYQPEGLDPAVVEAMEGSAPPPAHRTDLQLLDREQLPELPVDVFAPCATDSTVHAGNAQRVQARIVCAGANNPVTLAACEALHERGVLYLPDFITNAGGALGNTLKFAGLPERYLHRILAEEYRDELAFLCGESRRQARSPSSIAIELLDRKKARLKTAQESATGGKQLLGLALQAYRSGMVPKVLVRPLAYRKVQRSLGLR